MEWAAMRCVGSGSSAAVVVCHPTSIWSTRLLHVDVDVEVDADDDDHDADCISSLRLAVIGCRFGWALQLLATWISNRLSGRRENRKEKKRRGKTNADQFNDTKQK